MADELVDLTETQDALGRMAQEIMETGRQMAERALRLEGEATDPPILSALLLLRAVDLFQALLLVADAGLGGPARALARAVVETALCIAYLLDHPAAFIGDLEADDNAARMGQARVLLNQSLHGRLSTENRQALDAFIARLKAAKPRFLDVSALSEKGSVSSLYLLYRVLSGDAAHVSLASLSRYLEVDATGAAGLRPDRDRVDDIYGTLDHALRAFMAVCVAHTQIAGDTVGNADLARLERTVRKLPPAPL